MVDDIIDDLIAFNYARTGRISLNPCAPIEECSTCGSILESDGTCLDCEEEDDEEDSYDETDADTDEAIYADDSENICATCGCELDEDKNCFVCGDEFQENDDEGSDEEEEEF